MSLWWFFTSIPRAVLREEVFLCPQRCREESFMGKDIQNEATVGPQGCDYPHSKLTPEKSTRSDPPLFPLFLIQPLWLDVTSYGNFTFQRMIQIYREKPKGLWQSQIYCHHPVHEPKNSFTAMTHIPDRVLMRSVIWYHKSLQIMNNNRCGKGRKSGGSLQKCKISSWQTGEKWGGETV